MEIQEIKQKLPLSQVLHHYGLKPDKNHRLLCPFHADKTPSLQIYYKTHTCYCFSTNCKTHGKAMDVIDFILHQENCSKHEAILKASAMLGVNQSRASGIGVEKTASTFGIHQAPKTSSEQRIQILTRMFTYFKNGVSSSQPAKDYLEKRCLSHQKTEVGYNSGQFHHGKRKDEHLINECVKYGLLLDLNTKSRTGNPAYRPFGKWGIVFALRNVQHQIVGLYFRSTLDDKKQRHFYLKDRQGLYPCYPNIATKRLIITESIIDAATLLEQEEIKKEYAVLSLFGTNGWTEEHQKAIKNLADLEEIIFFLNGDAAGIKAVEKYAPMLKSDYPKLKITNVEVPENEDVNSLLQGHSPEILTHLIESRKTYNFLFSNKNERTPIGAEVWETSGGVNHEVGGQIKREVLLAKEEKTSPTSGLNTNNPFNLKYKTSTATYQIKGFKINQLDSLKITLQISIT